MTRPEQDCNNLRTVLPNTWRNGFANWCIDLDLAMQQLRASRRYCRRLRDRSRILRDITEWMRNQRDPESQWDRWRLEFVNQQIEEWKQAGVSHYDWPMEKLLIWFPESARRR